MKARNHGSKLKGWLCGALFVHAVLLPNLAFSQASFFQGKTITVIQGRDPGGTGDLRVKALFPFLQKYIPGNPTIVSEYMPGAGVVRRPITFTEPRAPTGSLSGI